MSFAYFATPAVLELPVHAPVTARALLILHLREIHAAGVAGREVNPVLMLDPESATAAAYRFGTFGMLFNLDDLLRTAPGGRRRLATPDPEHTVEFLETTGGSGESHEDNRDMVGVAV